MKRHPKLQKLSEEHQNALVAAMALKGERTLPQELGWPSEPDKKRDRFLRFAEDHLFPHFKEEESEIFPLAEVYSTEGWHLCERLSMEHQIIKQQIRLLRLAKGADLAKLLVELGNNLEEHVHREERELFELLQKVIPEYEMREN
ncbi:MAG TPA: hemerythrin domain-containing protein [Acidobacteriota bacterium]|jgi:hemerythrin-like domain-containing protein